GRPAGPSSLMLGNLASVFDALNMGVCLIGQDYEMQYVSAVLEKEFGRWRGKKCFEFFHGLSNICSRCPFEEVNAGKTVRREATSPVSARCFEFIPATLVNPDGSSSKLTVFHDVTDRKQSEEELAADQRSYWTLLTNLPGMAYRCRNDRNWTMEFVSRGCRELTGYEAADLVGGRTLHFNDIIVPEDRDRIWREVQKAVKKHRPFRLTYQIVTRGGDRKWVWEQGRAVEYVKGSAAILEGFITDITEHKQAQEELERLTDELESERRELEEKNVVLRHILEHLELERQEYKQHICRDVEQVVLPYLDRLKSTAKPAVVRQIKELEQNLSAILARDVDMFRRRYESLTPREMEICEFIKDGMSSKEIAESINLSPMTVNKHREEIRRKLGITNKQVNLSTYLRTR
ncbi:MAG: PAS domain S-box protein, partial [Candidatus Zixiibacteriota bacterium]